MKSKSTIVLLLCVTLLLVSCGRRNEVSLAPLPSLKLVPIRSFNTNINQGGWTKLNVEMAVANLYPAFRLFYHDCAGTQAIQATSAESRAESLSWTFNSECIIVSLPPGMVIGMPNIEGDIPQNMTAIELRIPFADLNSIYPANFVETNKSTTVRLDNDMQSIDFPIYDEALLDVHDSGESFDLLGAKAQIRGNAEYKNGEIPVQIRIKNTNSLDNSEFTTIMISGAGSDGNLRFAVNSEGDCHPPTISSGKGEFIFRLDQIGPDQTIVCNVKFTDIPGDLDNFHVWFNLVSRGETGREYNIIDSGTFRLSP